MFLGGLADSNNSHDVAPRASFTKTFDRVYGLAEDHASSSLVNAQEIALVYIVLAQGTMFSIEHPHYDSSMENWMRLSELALVVGNFLSNNQIPGLQTLVSQLKIMFSELVLSCSAFNGTLPLVSPGPSIWVSITYNRTGSGTIVDTVTMPGLCGVY